MQKIRAISGPRISGPRHACCGEDCGRDGCCRRIHYLGTAMPILSVRHVTTYRYNQPVAFGEHRMMLRPRDDDDQKVIEAELEITPRPKQLAWTRDSLGNHVATAHFGDRARELRFVSNYSSRPCACRLSLNRHKGFCPQLSVCLRAGRSARPRAFHRSRCRRIPRSIAGAPRSSATMALPTRTCCSAT